MNKTPEGLITTANEIIAESSDVANSIEELLSPPFAFREIVTVIKTLIRAAEIIWGDVQGAGSEKLSLVLEVWDQLNKKYNLVDKLDRMVELPWVFEVIDGIILNKGIVLIISAIVTIFNDEEIW